MQMRPITRFNFFGLFNQISKFSFKMQVILFLLKKKESLI